MIMILLVTMAVVVMVMTLIPQGCRVGKISNEQIRAKF